MNGVSRFTNEFDDAVYPHLARIHRFQRYTWCEAQVDNGEEQWTQQVVERFIERAVDEDAFAERHGGDLLLVPRGHGITSVRVSLLDGPISSVDE